MNCRGCPDMSAGVCSAPSEPRPPAALELRDRPGYHRIRLDRWRLIYCVDDEDALGVVARARLKTGPETYEDLPEA